MSDRAWPIQSFPVEPWYRTTPSTSPIRTSAAPHSMVAVPATWSSWTCPDDTFS
jgi:hypothetical protein